MSDSKNLRAYISTAWVSKAFGYTESIDEKSGSAQFILEGEFQRANAQNRNTRIYKFELLNRENNKLREIIESRGGHPMGMDHPIPDGTEASMTRIQRIDMENACGLTTWLEMQGDVVYGKAKIILGDYGTGDKLAAFVKAGYKPGVSSRGLGGDPVMTAEGYMYVPDDYNMICYDFVTNPSTHNAILQRSFQEEVDYYSHLTKGNTQKNVWEVLTSLSKKHIKGE